MTWCAVEPPFQESAGWFAPLLDLEVAESVLMEGAQEASEDYERFSAQRPVPPAASAGALLVVRVDGQGVPMLKEEAVTLKATWGTGEQRQRKTAALVGGSATVDPKPRSPEVRAALLIEPAAARARRQQQGGKDESPRAPQVRRRASLVRTKPAVMECIKADAKRRDPQHHQPLVVWLDGALGLWNLAPKRCKPWKRVTSVLDLIPVVSSLWTAANALCPEGSRGGKPWVQAKLTARLRGRVGDVIGGLRPLLTKGRLRTSVRETLAHVITCFQNHRRWRHDDAYLAMGLPVGTGVVESAGGAVVKHRMEGEGKRWSLVGAETILTLRSLTKSHDHDRRDYWRFRARQMRGRLYGHKPQYRPAPRLRRVASPNSKRLRSVNLAFGRTRYAHPPECGAHFVRSLVSATRFAPPNQAASPAAAAVKPAARRPPRR